MSDELCCSKEVEEEDGQIMSLDDSRIERVCDRLASLTVRVVALEYSQLHKIIGCLCFENVLHGGASVLSLHNVYRHYDTHMKLIVQVVYTPL